MAIQRRSKCSEQEVQKFIEGANPEKHDPPTKTKKPKKPVALRFDDSLLERIDAAARARGISRNAWISWQCAEGLKGE